MPEYTGCKDGESVYADNQIKPSEEFEKLLSELYDDSGKIRPDVLEKIRYLIVGGG